jgi:hypothetical protein
MILKRPELKTLWKNGNYMKTIPFTIASKKNQMLRSKLNEGYEWPLQGERDLGTLQKVERSSVLMDW